MGKVIIGVSSKTTKESSALLLRNMKIEEFLTHFPDWKQTGPDQYITHSPTREDKNPSLSISVSDDGRILIHDHGGATAEEVLHKVGLKMRDLYPEDMQCPAASYSRGDKRRSAAIYQYLDKNGNLVAEKVRYEPKAFGWRVPMAGSGYDYHKPKNVPPYNLPVLAKSLFVFLVEGEKDVDTLTKIDVPATTLPDGATNGRWQSQYTDYFVGKAVIIIPDNDKVGQDYAESAQKALSKVALKCATIDLKKWWPEIPEKGDVSDYIAAKGEEAVNRLQRLSNKAKNRAVQLEQANITPTATHLTLLEMEESFLRAIRKLDPYTNRRYSTTDNGSGLLFADLVKGQARYVPSQKQWYIYDGKRWGADEGNLYVMELCKMAGNALNRYAFDIKDERERAAYMRYTYRWLTRSGRKVILEDATSVYPISMSEFDADTYLINCENGTLDLKTGKFRDHDPEDKITKIANVIFDLNAKCPRFEQFVDEVMSNDADKSAFLQKALGYALSGDSRYECMFILYGATTRNGKSTLMESVLRVFGDYGATVTPETIAAKQRNSSGPSEDLARLAGKRLANISEPSRGLRLNAAQVKSMTGNDSINARFLHCNSFDYRPQFKLFINTNYLPNVDDMSLFSSNRVRVIPFDRHFEPQEQDPNLKYLFSEESSKSAILNWLIEGWNLLQKEGLSSPTAVVEAIEEYAHDSNKIALFAEDELVAIENAEVRTSRVYERYKEWCAANGCMPENSSNFRRSLVSIGRVDRKRPKDGGEKTTLLVGYRLKGDASF